MQPLFLLVRAEGAVVLSARLKCSTRQDSVLRTAKCPTSLSCKENLWTDWFIVNKVLCLALKVLGVFCFLFCNLGVYIWVIVLRCFIEGTCVISCHHIFPTWSWLSAFFSPELWVVWRLWALATSAFLSHELCRWSRFWGNRNDAVSFFKLNVLYDTPVFGSLCAELGYTSE